MTEQNQEQTASAQSDIRQVVKHVIEEFMRAEQSKAEPAYKAELLEERRRRESLEARLNQVVEEGRQARAAAELLDRHTQIKSELQRLGVAKIDLAFKAVKDEVVRAEDGRLLVNDGHEQKAMQEYLRKFVEENPELLPARISGGSGAGATIRSNSAPATGSVDLDKIKPGMSKEDLDRVRQEVARLASQALRGL